MLELFGTQPRLIIGNVVSDAVMDLPSDEYVRRMEAGMPRKIWIMREGDVLITSVPVPLHMKRYACQILGLEPDQLVCLTPAQHISPFLIENILADRDLMDQVRPLIADRQGIELYPFLLDKCALQLAQELHVPLSFYCGRYADDPHIQEMVRTVIYRLNCKSQFRNTMMQLGTHVACGRVVASPQEFRRAASELLEHSDKIIIKRDRGSNGYGHTIIDKHTPDVLSHIERFASEMLPISYVVENYVPPRWAPSIELLITGDGPYVLYPCDQRCMNNAWVGMSIPPLDLPDPINKAMTEAAFSFGHYLHQAGYRGVLDVDGVAAATGEWIVTETNLRTTGGTHMHTILTRLLGGDYLDHYCTVADSVPTNGIPFSTFFARIEQEQINFHPQKREGVVITVDGTHADQKFRYLVFARRADRVLQMETVLRNLL